jgi:hypothetical protein
MRIILNCKTGQPDAENMGRMADKKALLPKTGEAFKALTRTSKVKP